MINIIQMREERDTFQHRLVKFDLRKRRMQQHLNSTDLLGNDKRKPSFSLSSDACVKSPTKKQLKQFESQNPGGSYFQNLFKKNDEAKLFISHLQNLPALDVTQLDLRIQLLLRSVDYTSNDEQALLSHLDTLSRSFQLSPCVWDSFDQKFLVWIVAKLGLQQNRWKEIACLFSRQIGEVRARWNALLKSCQIGQLWTEQEDATLQHMVSTYLANQQLINWKCMANVLNKDHKLCKDRWYNYLDPALCRDPFLVEEDILMLQLVLKFGKRWHNIQREWSLKRKRSRQDIKRRFYELLQIPDSGYESDVSSQSQKRNSKIDNDSVEKIKSLIEELQKKEEMQIEEKRIPKDKLLKNKLLNIAKSDLDKLLAQQRSIKIQPATPSEVQVSDLYAEMEEDLVVDDYNSTRQNHAQNSPAIMNNLSRCLLNINLENEDDCLSIEKPFKAQVHYTVEGLERLTHEDLFDIQFGLINDKQKTIYFANLEFMQQLINLITNQRKLMLLTDVKQPTKLSQVQKGARKKFSSQQLIQIHSTEYKKPQLSHFGQEIGSDDKPI